MKRTGRLLIGLVLLGGVLCALPSAAERFGEIEVQALPQLPSGYGGHGYIEYPFQVTNHGDQRHTVTLAMPKVSLVYQKNGLRRLSRSIELAPRATARLELLRPRLAFHGTGVEVLVDGQPAVDALPYQPGSSSDWSSSHPEVLLGLRLSPAELPKSEPATFLTYRAEMPVADWSRRWLAYSSFAGILVTADELAAAPPPVQQALARWVEAGGSMLLLGAVGKDHGFHRQLTASHRRAVTAAGWAESYAGFGVILEAAVASLAELSESQLQRLEESWQRSHEPWKVPLSLTTANREFPVAGNLRIPVRGLFLLVLLFAVLIGPVNLSLLRRYRRRIWILWTVPLAAVLTCLLLLGYAFLSEGVSRERRAEGLTLLDQGQRRAVTLGTAGYYSPLAVTEGLRFDEETEVTAAVGPYSSLGGGSPRLVLWQGGQLLRGGWMRARLPTYMTLRKPQLRRERLAVRRTADGIEVVNGLGADVGRLWLADEAGQVHFGFGIGAGSSATLQVAEGRTAQGGADAQRKLYLHNWRLHHELLGENGDEYLQPGSYIALLTQEPFLEEGMGRVEEPRQQGAVYGLLAEEAL